MPSLKRTLQQQHRSAQSIIAHRNAERKKDAMAFAELIYSVYKEKKRKEKRIIIDGQNNAQLNSSN